MTSTLVNILGVFAVGAFFTGLLIPQILLIAFQKKLFDVPDERKIHRLPVPRLGGIAFAPVIFFSMAFVFGLNLIYDSELVGDVRQNIIQLVFSSCVLIVLFLIGIADDLIGVKYRAKFFGQILCGLLLAVSGLTMDSLHGFLGINDIPLWLGYSITVFLTVFITNAINLIDGIDGLASGLSAVALMFYGVILWYFGQHTFSLLAFATVGTIVPFFYYNVFGKAEKFQKIFMGDTGSLTVGALLTVLSIKLAMVQPIGGLYRANPLVLAFAPLMVPCLDVVRVFFHRVRVGKNPFLPDKSHIHHKIMNLGLSQRQAMIVIIFGAFLLGSINILVSSYVNVNILLPLDLITYLFVNNLITMQIKKRVEAGLLPEEAIDDRVKK